jgi:hypothetical protein
LCGKVMEEERASEKVEGEMTAERVRSARLAPSL